MDDLTKGERYQIELYANHRMMKRLLKTEIQWRIKATENRLKKLKAHPTFEKAVALANAATELGSLLHTITIIELILDDQDKKDRYGGLTWQEERQSTSGAGSVHGRRQTASGH